jgi:hypothetical protein
MSQCVAVPFEHSVFLTIGLLFPLIPILYYSIDVITAQCKRLSQLTLWGCIKMRNLKFRMFNGSDKLVILNLWGCYNLNDDVAASLGNMKHLSSLIVSECHRLTDRFVVRKMRL